MKTQNLVVGYLLLIIGSIECLAISGPVKGFQVVSNKPPVIIGELTVGQQSASNVLHIISGARVNSSSGYIGFFHNAHQNSVLVDDSEWNNSSSLFVGLMSRGNSLEIANSGEVTSGSIYVGSSRSSHSNVVSISSGGSLGVEETLSIGNYSSGNQVLINDGSVTVNAVSIGFGEGSSENGVLMAGGSFRTDSNFVVGGAGSNNYFNVYDGGAVNARSGLIIGQDELGAFNAFSISGSNSVANLQSLEVGLAGRDNRFYASEGSFIDVDDIVIIGAGETAINNQLWLRDEGTLLSSEHLTVGEEGRANQLRLYEGAEAWAESMAIGVGSNAAYNLVLVDDSRLEIDNELQVGIEGFNNRLVVRHGGYLETDGAVIGSGANARNNRVEISSGSSWNNEGHLALANRSSLVIGSGAHVATGSYSQDGTSKLIYGFDAEAGTDGVGRLEVEDAAIFEQGALIDFTAPLSQLEIDDAYTLMTASKIVGGSLTNDVSQILPEQLLLDVEVVEEGDRASLQYTRKSLIEVTGLAGTEMEALLQSIDTIAPSNQQAEAMLQAINRSGGSSEDAAAKLEQLYSRRVEVVSVVEQARVTALGQISAHVRTVQENKQRYAIPAPLGPSGPHKAGQGWAPWFKGYGAKGKASQQEDFSGYDARTYGGVFGIDRSIGAILGGVAFGYSDSAIDQNDGDESDIGTYYGYLYGSAGVRQWYADFSLGYGRSSVDAASGTGLGSSASYNADDFTGYVAVGRQARMQQWLITPQFGLNGSYYIQEAYTESGGSVAGTEVDEYDRWSLRYSLGVALAYERMWGSWIVKPEVRAYWLHEFNADVDEVEYRLIGGGGGYTYSLRAPEEDVIELGLGLEFLYADRLKFTLDFDAEMGEFYEGYSASCRLAYEF